MKRRSQCDVERDYWRISMSRTFNINGTMFTCLRQWCCGTLRAWLWFTKTGLRPLLAPNIAHHFPLLSAPSQHLIHKAHSAHHVRKLIHPQSLTVEWSLPSFCVKLSLRILSQRFSLFYISQNTDCFIMDTAERFCRTFCRKPQFCLLLTVDCVLQLTRYKRLQNQKKSVHFHTAPQLLQ